MVIYELWQCFDFDQPAGYFSSKAKAIQAVKNVYQSLQIPVKITVSDEEYNQTTMQIKWTNKYGTRIVENCYIIKTNIDPKVSELIWISPRS